MLFGSSVLRHSGLVQNHAMFSWAELAREEPELSEACRSLFYQYGVGLAFLGTVRPDGGPRLHPICPLIEDRGLFAFLIPSPKRDDLHRDPRYALHSFPAEQNEDAVYLRGRASVESNHRLREELAERFFREREMSEAPPGWEDQELFEFRIERCLRTVSTGHGDPNPTHRVWRAPSRSDQ
jgi:hypothetical protein